MDSDAAGDGGSPSEQQSAPNPFADPPPVNPYETPVGEVSRVALSPAEARSRLTGPAVGMIVGGLISLLPIIQITVNSILTFRITVDQVQAELPDDPATQAMATFMVAAFLLVLLGVLIIVTALVIAGAVAMLRMRSYWLAKTGAILSLTPCYCCFPIGLPFGIWGLMVLNDINVRAAFQSARG